MGTVPSGARAIVVTPGRSVVGFAADPVSHTMFIVKRSEKVQRLPLASPPPLYAYAHDAAGTTLCVVQASSAGQSLQCYGDASPAASAATFPVGMTSGALVTPDTLWAVDSSGRRAPKRSALVLLQRSAGQWQEKARRTSPLCGASDAELLCSEMEVHPTGPGSIALIPLFGRIDARSFIYPTLGIWKHEEGSVKRIPVPPLPVPAQLAAPYGALGTTPVRLVYRSAASRGGRIAIVPELPHDPRERPRRDQLWLYDGASKWTKITAPESLTAVAFDDETPVVVTRDGAVLRWTP